jgi:hypothetical protein
MFWESGKVPIVPSGIGCFGSLWRLSSFATEDGWFRKSLDVRYGGFVFAGSGVGLRHQSVSRGLLVDHAHWSKGRYSIGHLLAKLSSRLPDAST